MRAGLATDKWKTSVDDYVVAAGNLLTSIRWIGFSLDHPIPVDPFGELLGGAHRLAAALALDLNAVPVEPIPMRAWAPAWDRQWFVANHVPTDDLERIMADWKSMQS